MCEPMVAFSCDDVSPKTKITKLKELLKTADRFDITVTFFVIPKRVTKWSSCGSLVRVLKDAQSCGHEIGLHGLDHTLFEAGNPIGTFGFGYSSVKDKILKGLGILHEKLETDPKGFRAPYHQSSQSLLRVLDDLNFLYDSSEIALRGVLFSYVPPLRIICVSRKWDLFVSKAFHPWNLKLWEIPIAQEYTWYNLKFEVSLFEAFLKKSTLEIKAGCPVINSHIGAISTWGLRILKELFLYFRETGISKLTLHEMAERYTTKGYCV